MGGAKDTAETLFALPAPPVGARHDGPRADRGCRAGAEYQRHLAGGLECRASLAGALPPLRGIAELHEHAVGRERDLLGRLSTQITRGRRGGTAALLHSRLHVAHGVLSSIERMRGPALCVTTGSEQCLTCAGCV